MPKVSPTTTSARTSGKSDTKRSSQLLQVVPATYDEKNDEAVFVESHTLKGEEQVMQQLPPANLFILRTFCIVLSPRLGTYASEIDVMMWLAVEHHHNDSDLREPS